MDYSILVERKDLGKQKLLLTRPTKPPAHGESSSDIYILQSLEIIISRRAWEVVFNSC